MEKKINVVSVCFEAMLSQKFHIYAGGLGVVQAGLLKSAGRGEWPVNMYGLGILWKQGYYDQKIGPNGMEAHYVVRHYDFLEDTGVKVTVDINGKSNTIKVWRLPPEVFKTVPCFFLDTDVDGNDGLARSITQHLYGGNEETRLAQEIVLGIGGVRAFEALGIPVDLWHGHEGHALLAAIELLRRNYKARLASFFSDKEAIKKLTMEEKKEIKEKAFKEACGTTRKQFVFTTHTPEIAGNEFHHIDLMVAMGCFRGIPKALALQVGGYPFNHGMFNMTIGGFRLAKIANAVSKLHLETVCQMWCGIGGLCPLISITNGVDEDWQFPEFVQANTPEDIQKAHEKYQKKLFQYIECRAVKKFKEGVLTIVWARRQTDYKRPWLMFMDWPWLKELLLSGKIQIIVAGKPHPHDRPAIIFFNWVYEKSLEVPNLAILANYGYDQNKLLKAGCDLWLQTSRRPREACGTSWMSATALVMSSRDGGILESDPDNYFPFGVDYPCAQGEQDTLDFQDFKRFLESVMNMYYNDKPQWHKKKLAAIVEKRKKFSSDRMLKEYIEMYLYKF